MTRPEPIHLSAEDGEAIIARLSVYAPTPSDCESLIVVMRLHFWLMFALQLTFKGVAWRNGNFFHYP